MLIWKKVKRERYLLFLFQQANTGKLSESQAHSGSNPIQLSWAKEAIMLPQGNLKEASMAAPPQQHAVYTALAWLH